MVDAHRGGAGRIELCVLGQPPPERADAARSRRALLTAARVMLTRGGGAAISLDELAAEAGVGVGTVYRRFGDRGGLATALLDDAEQRFQGAFIFGPPPLGPGAPPADRLRAFLHAYVERLHVEADLHAMAERQRPTARFDNGAYRAHHAHLVSLLRAAGSYADPEYLADALLALVTGGLFIHHHRERRLSLARINAGLDELLDRLLGSRLRPP